MTAEPEILFETRGSLALVTLNRPKALNALTLPMIRALHPRLRDWAADPQVRAVLVQGVGGRAFCAGGDIRAIWQGLQDGGELPAAFFREEYALNYEVHRFPKAYIALIDGIVMGGGVGISVHGSHRIATEHTTFAMPETGIGLFPDVGGSYFLPRLEGQIGLFLALTGQRLKAADCLYAGIATHYVESARRAELIEALAAADLAVEGAVDEVISNFAASPGPATLSEHRAAIDRCFAGGSVEEILAALGREATPWAEKLAAHMATLSPTSLKLTFRQIRDGARLSFADAMVAEYRLSQHCMAGHDFAEGVRALIIDKDNAPRWQPDSLGAVSNAMIEDHFAPLGEKDLRLS